MFFVASCAAAALNRQLTAGQRGALAAFAGKVVGFRWRKFSLTWRINADGGFAAAQPLLAADAELLAAGGEVHLRGDAKLLRLLSALAEETDWAVVASGAFGPAFAPRALLAIERGRAAFAEALRRHTASAAEVAEYADNVKQFAARVETLSAQLQKAEA